MGAIMHRCAFIVVPAILLSVSSEAVAQGATTGGEAPAFDALDTFWIIFAAVLVFFVPAGSAWSKPDWCGPRMPAISS